MSISTDDRNIDANSLTHITDENQKIQLLGNDSNNTYPIYSKDIDIVVSKNSSQSRINASNKIKVNKIVNYEWEQRYSHGNMIAVHKSGQYFAYSIRVDSNGKVKVFNKKLNEKVLLKSFRGRVVDLSFAHYDAEVLLGCVDETGCCQIFKITLDQDSKMQTTLVFNLASLTPNISLNDSTSQASRQLGMQTPTKIGTPSSNVSRIIWCMYIPDNTNGTETTTTTTADHSPENGSKVFALTRKNRVDIFHLGMVQDNYDCSTQLETDDMSQGHLIINEKNSSSILSASFAPDGSAIATAGQDGEVKFYKLSFQDGNINDNDNQDKSQEYISEDEDINTTPKQSNDKASNIHNMPKCINRWRPHGDKPVTSIYFLDDHKNPSLDASFWTYVVTGADFNREIKIWCCTDWQCLQTIRFTGHSASQAPPPGMAEMDNKSAAMPMFKTSLDASSTYLVMSDITRKCFYVLHLFKNLTDENMARCTAISEYILAYPALSFAIIDSSTRKARKYNQLNNVNSNAASVDEVNFDSLNSELSSLPQSMMSSSSSSSSLQHTGVGNENTDLVTMIRLYCIQTKQLQEMQIFLSGDQSTNAYNNSSNSPPPIQTKYPSTTNTPQPHHQHSILSQLLPGTASPRNFNSSQQLSSADTNLLNSLAKLNLSASNSSINNTRMKQANNNNASASFIAEPTDVIVSDNDYELQQLNKSASSQSIIRSLLPNLKASSNNNNASFTNGEAEDPSIIHIVTPTPQQLTTPVLLTPDAFINSPTNGRKSLTNASDNSSTSKHQQQTNKATNDILQSLISGNVNGGAVSLGNSLNVSQSNNLMSSRASSLTHVTAATNLAPAADVSQQLHQQQPVTVLSNMNNISVGSQNSQTSQTKQKLKSKKEKNRSPFDNRKQRTTNSSSSSCSTCSSSCSGSDSDSNDSTASSIMDSADKEIAALSSSGNSKLVAQIGTIQSSTTESLLNKVALSTAENEDKSEQQQQQQELPKPAAFQMQMRGFGLQGQSTQQQQQQHLNQSWPLQQQPLKSGFKPTEAGMQQQTNGFASSYNGSQEMTGNNVGELKELLVQMTQALRVQHEEIQNLKQHQMSSQSQLESHIDTTLNKLIKQQQSTTNVNLNTDEVQLNMLIQQSLTKHVQPRLEKLFKEEIHKAVQNQFVSRLMEPLREQITSDLAEKLKSIEGVLKDQVSRLFKSKSTLDSISQSIVSSQQATIVNSYRDTFQKVIVPNFEKSCQNMYQQVNSSFSKGTQDYLVEFESLANKHGKKFDESREPILSQLNKFNEQISNQTSQMGSILANNLQQQFEANLRNTNAILQDTIISSVKAIIKEEIQLAMRDQQQTLPDHLINQMRRSGTVTPLPGGAADNFNAQNANNDVQYQISQYLKKGFYNSAFQSALCAANLSLLENLCELISPAQAFDQQITKKEAKLQQPVILSLIQQLSQDMNSNTDLKVRYLEEAIVNLDMTVPLTIEHSPQVINSLLQSLQEYVSTHNQNDKFIKPMKMLLLAGKSLMKDQRNSGSGLKQQAQNGNNNSNHNNNASQSTNSNSSNTNGNKTPAFGNVQILSQTNQQLTNQLKKNLSMQQTTSDQY